MILCVIITTTLAWLHSTANTPIKNSQNTEVSQEFIDKNTLPPLTRGSNNNNTLKQNFNSITKFSSNHNQDLPHLVRAIEIASLKEPTTLEQYQQCLQLTDRITETSLQDEKVHEILLKCRILRNRFGLSESRTEKWQEVRQMLRDKGWPYFLKKLQTGEIPANISLQEGEPKHNLYMILVSGDIQDIEAFETIAQMGVEPNSKAFLLAMSKQNDEFIKFYKNTPHFYTSNDMLNNPVSLAASSGRLDYMSEFLDLGVPYKDPANSSPLQIYLSGFASRTSPEALASFVHRHNITINELHVSAAKRGNAPKEIIKLLNRLKED